MSGVLISRFLFPSFRRAAGLPFGANEAVANGAMEGEQLHLDRLALLADFGHCFR